MTCKPYFFGLTITVGAGGYVYPIPRAFSRCLVCVPNACFPPKSHLAIAQFRLARTCRDDERRPRFHTEARLVHA